jgi:hypothetical protein
MNERGGSQNAIEVEQHSMELLIEGGRVHNPHAIHHVGKGHLDSISRRLLAISPASNGGHDSASLWAEIRGFLKRVI